MRLCIKQTFISFHKLTAFATVAALTAVALFSSCKPQIETKEYVAPVEFSAEETEGGTRMIVSMSTATEEAEIFYTTDGSAPTSQSTKYTGPVTLIQNTTIKAFAVKAGLENSPISVATVSITEKTVVVIQDNGESYNWKIDMSPLLVRKTSEKSYIWKSGVKTDDYDKYICAIDLTESFARLPLAGESVKITWKGQSDKTIPTMQLKLVDNNTKTANWAQTLSETITLSNISANEDFSVDYNFTFNKNPIEKVILQFIYKPDVIDSEATFQISGLLSPLKKDFELAPSGKPVVNPHKGFVQYAWSSQYMNNKYWDVTLASGKNEAWDYCTVVYTGCGWDSIQKGKEEYDWTGIDNLLNLCGQSNRTLGWRIYPTNSSVEEGGDHVPQFIYDEGCGSVQATVRGTERKIRVPDWEDPIYIQACKDFAAEMAHRYDGDSRVEFIDIRAFGNWGEWHCFQLEGSEMPSKEIQKDMIAYYKSVFKTTQLVVPSDCRDDVYEYALSIGVGKRDDGLIQIKGREDELAKCYKAGLPAVGENCATYADLLKNSDADRYNQKWTLDLWKSVINVSHMTYYELDRQDCGKTFFNDNADAVKEMVNKLGYNFEVISANLSYDRELNVQLTVKIKNTGLAPAFFDMNLIADITDNDGNRKAQLANIKRIKKGSFADGDEKTFVFIAPFTSLRTGDSICLGLYEDALSETPSVKFDNKNTLSNNKLKLCSF
jgi:hypothetical protein